MKGFDSIEEGLKAFAVGQMVICVDDEDRENEGQVPQRGEGKANQLDSFTMASEIFPWERKRISPKIIPPSMAVVCRKPFNQWDKNETNSMIKMETPKTVRSPC